MFKEKTKQLQKPVSRFMREVDKQGKEKGEWDVNWGVRGEELLLYTSAQIICLIIVSLCV